MNLAETNPPATTNAAPVRVSVIMPVLNEQARIVAALEELATVASLLEVIVMDGGSTDATADLVASFPRVRLLHAPRGRARQMNAGAHAASGDVLLFLHADVTLPVDAIAHVRRALADPRVVAGAFRTWTVADDGERRRWSPLLHLADLRSRYSGLPYGDQALFVRAATFRAVGGFPDQPLMEDLELSRRLRAAGALRTVPASVRVSGRRFLARPFYFTLLVNVLPLLYRVGVPARILCGFYGHPR